jgi:hypothetical protein
MILYAVSLIGYAEARAQFSRQIGKHREFVEARRNPRFCFDAGVGADLSG